MNERIKELESQCWVKVPCDFDMREGGLSTIRTVFDRQKFAELIVKECVSIIAKRKDIAIDRSWGRDAAALYLAALDIEEHFGVE